MVSISRLAFLPHLGHAHSAKVLDVVSGDSPFPVNSTSVGSMTGRFSSFSGTQPQSSQYIIGIGVPQYLCLEISQSRSL